MASSDEEGEILPGSVTGYEFINQEDQHVTFSCLPLLCGKDEAVDNSTLCVFLSGTCNDGHQRLYKQVIAWRYELSYVQPEISVLCKGNHWIKLLKPKKLFEAAIRSILVTIHCLHFVKHNHEAQEESLWCHLSRVFSTYEVAPSEVDCMNHIPLIRDAADNDKDLASSKYVLRILSEQPVQRKVLQMESSRPEFVVDEVVDDHFELHESGDKEEELFDTCCSLCDNGGAILCCEGRCMRSFHPTVASGEGSCESLGLCEAQVNAIPNFFCKNCQFQQHQCFICGKLGSSDISSNPEVFPCVAANCGRFYHPKCVAEELQKRNDIQTEELEKTIVEGESFTCPAHKCAACNQVEDRKCPDKQFAICRRCPKSYHRKCLPREISFTNDFENQIQLRAWEDLLPKRILIYCLNHKIIPGLGTPLRNHICFPENGKEKDRAPEQQLTIVNVMQKKRKLIPSHSPAESSVWKMAKQGKKVHYRFKGSESAKVVGTGICRPGSDAKKKANFSTLASAPSGPAKNFLKAYASSAVTEDRSVLENNKFNLEKKLKSYLVRGNANISCKELITVGSAKPLMKKKGCSSSVMDIKIERKIIALMKDVDSSFNMDELKRKQKTPSSCRSSENMLDKSLTKGNVEVTVKAIRTALLKLNTGSTVDDAKAVCSPETLCQVPVWKKKLDVYLSPFLRGMRYSSYGRHFTKLEKLQEIVDFCCGANDFSCLMKEKVDRAGKKCSFKNYDLFPTKNDFNFEQRDWFTVAPEELPAGSQLIMGLNPPFGVKATRANQFINKALQFKPKLLILIVPPETRRLDSRTDGKKYDLVWEDLHLLAGKAFYLPGSVDTHNKQMSQWNIIPPTLALWSRPDWTGKHKVIAKRCGHLCLPKQQPPPGFQPPTWNYLLEEQQDCYGDFSSLMSGYRDLPSMLDDVPEPTEHELNGSMFNNPSNIPRFENPGTDLEDMDISPNHPPTGFIA